MSAATLVVLTVVLEVAVRRFVPAELFTAFKPIYRADPACGYTLVPNYAGDAFGAPLSTNEIGFRGPTWPRQKPPGVVRVAWIGDSHAFGFGVPEHQAVAADLTRRLEGSGRRCEALDFALPGFNAEQQLATLEHFALDYAPDIVVVLSCENDHAPAPWADADGWLHERAAQDGVDVKLASPPLASDLARTLGLHRSHLYLWIKLMWRKAQADERTGVSATRWQWLPAPDEQHPTAAEPLSPRLATTVYPALSRMVQLCGERDVPIVVATFAAALDYQSMYARVARETGVPVVHLLQLFPDAHSYAELFERHGLGWDNHLDAAAHSTWAAALERVVIDQLERRGR